MENPTDLNTARAEATKRQAEGTSAMLLAWAKRQGETILQQMEIKRHKDTLSLHWGIIKQGWLGGFASGVQAGFQLGYQTANRLQQNEETEAAQTDAPDPAQIELPLKQGD